MTLDIKKLRLVRAPAEIDVRIAVVFSRNLSYVLSVYSTKKLATCMQFVIAPNAPCSVILLQILKRIDIRNKWHDEMWNCATVVQNAWGRVCAAAGCRFSSIIRQSIKMRWKFCRERRQRGCALWLCRIREIIICESKGAWKTEWHEIPKASLLCPNSGVPWENGLRAG